MPLPRFGLPFCRCLQQRSRLRADNSASSITTKTHATLWSCRGVGPGPSRCRTAGPRPAASRGEITSECTRGGCWSQVRSRGVPWPARAWCRAFPACCRTCLRLLTADVYPMSSVLLPRTWWCGAPSAALPGSLESPLGGSIRHGGPRRAGGRSPREGWWGEKRGGDREEDPAGLRRFPTSVETPRTPLVSANLPGGAEIPTSQRSLSLGSFGTPFPGGSEAVGLHGPSGAWCERHSLAEVRSRLPIR